MSARHQIAIGPIPTAEERAAIYRRLRGPAKVVNIRDQIRAPEPEAVEELREPADAHVTAYRAHLARRDQCLTPGSYVRFLCDLYSISYDTLEQRTRFKAVVAVKHQIIFDLRQRYPHLTMSQIGRLVGNVDHTTVFHALRKFGHEPGDRGRLTPEQIDRIKALHAEGVPITHIAKEIGCGPDAVRCKVDPEFRRKQVEWNARSRKARRK